MQQKRRKITGLSSLLSPTSYLKKRGTLLEVLLGAFLLCSFQLSAGTIYSLSKSADPLKDFISTDPETVAVSWDAKGGKFGKGALTFHFKKAKKGPVQILGPELPLEKRGLFVAGRMIAFDAHIRISACGHHPMQMRFQIGKNRFAWAKTPHRFWETLLDPEGYQLRWKNGDDMERMGSIGNGVTRGRVLFLADPEKAGGKLVLERFDVKELYTISHRVLTASSDNHYTAEKAEIKVQIYQPEKLSAGSIRMVDEQGRLWKEIALKKGEPEVRVSLDQQGYYELTVDAKYEDKSSVKTVRTLAVTGPRLPEAVRQQSRFGICRVHATGNWALKIGSNVQYGGWSLGGVKPGPDGKMVYQGKPVTWDKGVRTHAAMFGKIAPHLLKKEHRNKNGFYPPEDWDKFAEAVYVWAKANPMPAVMNIFNEPNGSWNGSKSDFIRIHNVITDSIKKAKPDAKVGGPGFYSIPPVHEFRRYVDAGILRNMDYLVMHAYVNATPPEGLFIEKIIALQEYMQTTPYRDLPIAFTEFGWCTPPGDWQKPVTPLTQARYCARSLVLCTVRNIRDMTYFCGKFGEYQIIHSDDTPTPALPAYCVVVQELAAVEKGGIWVRIDPSTHAAFFPRDGKTISVFWTGKGEKDLVLPAKPLYVRAMTGTRLAADAKLHLSESPVYAFLEDTRWNSMKEHPVQEILPGMTFRVPGKVLIRPDSVIPGTDDRFRMPEKAEHGIYSFVTEINGKLEVYRFQLKEPFRTEFKGVAWDGAALKGTLKFEIFARTSFPAVTLTLKSGKDQPQTKTVALKKGINLITFDLNKPVNGKRYLGKLEARAEKPYRWQFDCEWDATPLVIPYLTKSDRLLWKFVPEIAIDPWALPGTKNLAKDLKASFKAYASPAGIHFRVTVNDPFMNRQTVWTEMWKSDSLQIALDVDADDVWQPNRVDGRFNGHRLMQAGYSRAQKADSPQVWVFSSFIPQGIQSGPGFELMKTARVLWKNPGYVYEFSIPWKLLGISAPKPGSRIGFALLINSADKKYKRWMLPFFDGIGNWNPANFGKITLQKAD